MLKFEITYWSPTIGDVHTTEVHAHSLAMLYATEWARMSGVRSKVKVVR